VGFAAAGLIAVAGTASAGAVAVICAQAAVLPKRLDADRARARLCCDIAQLR